MTSLRLACWTLLVACGGPADPDAAVGVDAGGIDGGAVDAGSPDAGPLPRPLAPLPPAASAGTDHFVTHDRCASCHQAQDGTTALRDASGRDVSPVSLWRTSMMSFAARDPVYLAAFAHELEENPGASATIEATCTRCHTAGASVESGLVGTAYGLEALTTGTAALDHVAREGVTCTVCHQIRDERLGTPDSFTGGFVIGADRQIFGPHDAPFVMPMVMSTGFTPVASSHVRDSELCATCHTVITRALDEDGAAIGPAFPEQVPYLEWRNSVFATGGAMEASCQDCHVPTVDADGVPIRTAIATRPNRLGAREPVGRHGFRGANAYVLGLLAANRDWVGTTVPAAALADAAAETEAHLGGAASVVIASVAVEGEMLVARIRVENRSGHRFPTGYPTRRAWLRVSGLDATGEARWISGRVDGAGHLIDAAGARLDGPFDPLDHRQTVEAQDQVQVWHAEMVDLAGARTHVLLRAAGYRVDDRILPLGWSPTHRDAALTAPVGVDGDPDFVPGADTVEYRIPRSSGATAVRAELLFQSVPPSSVEALADHPTPAFARLRAMVDATPPAPVQVAVAEASP